jgi:hypothetical protein
MADDYKDDSQEQQDWPRPPRYEHAIYRGPFDKPMQLQQIPNATPEMGQLQLAPFTQADDLEIQKLHQGLSSAREAMYNGEIDQDGYNQYMEQIHPRLSALTSRQQKAKQQAQAEQQSQMMHGIAQQQAMAHANAVHDAQTMNDRVAWITDPLSGRTAAFMPTEHGKMQQIDWNVGEKEEPEEPSAPKQSDQTLDYLPPPEASPVNAGETQTGPGTGNYAQGAGPPVSQGDNVEMLLPGQQPGGKGPFGSGLAGPSGGGGPQIYIGGQLQGEPKPPTPNENMPWSPQGGFRETAAQRAAHKAYTQTGSVPRDVHEQALKDTEAQMDGHARSPEVNQAEMAELYNRAERSIRLPPGKLRDQAVIQSYNHLLAAHTNQKQKEYDRENAAKERRMEEGARAKAASLKEQKAEREKAEKEKKDDYKKDVTHHMDKLHDEEKQYRKDKAHYDSLDAEKKKNTPEPKKPSHFGSDDRKMEIAQKRAEAINKAVEGHKHPEKAGEVDPEAKASWHALLQRVGLKGEGDDARLDLEGAQERDLIDLHTALHTPKEFGKTPEQAKTMQKHITEELYTNRPKRMKEAKEKAKAQYEKAPDVQDIGKKTPEESSKETEELPFWRKVIRSF